MAEPDDIGEPTTDEFFGFFATFDRVARAEMAYAEELRMLGLDRPAAGGTQP